MQMLVLNNYKYLICYQIWLLLILTIILIMNVKFYFKYISRVFLSDRFLRCSPFDEFKLWKRQVDNKSGEFVPFSTKSWMVLSLQMKSWMVLSLQMKSWIVLMYLIQRTNLLHMFSPNDISSGCSWRANASELLKT